MNRPFLRINKHPLEADEAGEVGGVLICVGHFGNLLSFEIVDETEIKSIRFSNLLLDFAPMYFWTPSGSQMGPTK